MIIIILIILLLVGIYFIGRKFSDYALKTDSNADEEIKKAIIQNGQLLNKAQETENEKKNEALEWLSKQRTNTINITSNDNLTLYAQYIQNKTHNYAILVHGFQDDHNFMQTYAYHYYNQGFNIVNIDQRAHGKSEGQYTTMGWMEEKDMYKWINFIINRDNQAKIILHGVSMGASTIMMLLKNRLPKNIKVCIADCGYSSLWQIYSQKIKDIHKNIPATLILLAASVATRIKPGFWIHKVSPQKALENNEIPILFIHGNKDNYVPYETMDILYNANKYYKKEKLTIIGAEHAKSIYTNYEKYWDEIDNFMKKYF